MRIWTEVIFSGEMTLVGGRSGESMFLLIGDLRGAGVHAGADLIVA